jgi:hypothetical protein
MALPKENILVSYEDKERRNITNKNFLRVLPRPEVAGFFPSAGRIKPLSPMPSIWSALPME